METRLRTCSLRLETSSTAPVCGCPGNRNPAAPTACAPGKPTKGTAAVTGTTKKHLNYFELADNRGRHTQWQDLF